MIKFGYSIEIEKIFKSIKDLSGLVHKNNPNWSLRALIAYKVFRAFDKYRFRLEPADLDGVLAELGDCKKLFKKVVAVEKNNIYIPADSEEFQDKESQMQYLYGLAWSQ